MESKIEVITPDIAKKYLEKNIVNRSLKQSRVRTLASDMKNGEWQLNGESIRFNKSGKLIDGQHRLSAIVAANVPISIMVTRNVSDDVTLYDRNIVRSEADALQIGGVSKDVANSRVISAAKLHYYIQTSSNVVPFAFIKDFIEEYEETLRQTYLLSRKKGGGNKATKCARLPVEAAYIFLPCFYTLVTNNADIGILERFLTVLKTGFYDSNKNESSAIVLRNDLIANNLDTHGGSVARKYACYSVEKALYDFINHNNRIVTYKNCNKPIYSNDKMFEEQIKKFR